MKLEDFISSDAYTPVNKALSRHLGFICAGFLGELIRQRKRFGGGEFYYSQEEMEKDIGISAYMQRTSIATLVEKGCLIVTKKGIPCKNWYIIVDEAIFNLYIDDEKVVENKLSKFGQLDVKNLTTGCENFDNYSNKKENKKENKKIKDSSSSLDSALEEFEDMRKKIKKPLTSSAKKRLVARLDNLAKSDEEKIAILNQSVDHCWQDVYELKKPISTEPQTNIEWVQFFNKCYTEGTNKEKILDKYGREKYEKIKSLRVGRCITGTVDNNFIL